MYKGDKEDYKTLCTYARSMGISVRNKKRISAGDAGAFTYDKKHPQIEISATNYQDKVLILLHELGHAKSWFLDSKMLSPEMSELMTKNMKDMQPDERWAVYIHECTGIAWMLRIAKFLELKIPYQVVCVEQEQDRWIYREWANTGEFPSAEWKRNNRKYLEQMWGEL